MLQHTDGHHRWRQGRRQESRIRTFGSDIALRLGAPMEQYLAAFLVVGLVVSLAVFSFRRKEPFAHAEAQRRMQERQKAESVTAAALAGYNLGTAKRSVLLDHMLR